MRTTEHDIVVIDGAQGEGGGQIVRTALSLAMCLGKSVQINDIRSGRKKPGLLRQHLACLRAAQTICDAQVLGAELGSDRVSFSPGAIKAGEYRFAIGSAGSTTLLFQTVLPALLSAGSTSEVSLEGGTHNPLAPSYDFIDQCFRPVLAKIGYRFEMGLERYGFYPAGGGASSVRIHPPKTMRALELIETGELVARTAVATSAKIPKHVTQRELARVGEKCGWPATSLQQRLVPSAGPGNILALRVDMEQVTEMCEVVGERSVSAERVAGRAIHQLKRYLAAGVPVGEHLADQLILPMVLGKGGRFRTVRAGQHLLTNIEVIRQVAGTDIKLTKIDEDCWEVGVMV